jgi:pyruvate,water dikinase
MCTTDEFEILKLKSSAIPVRKKRFLRFDLQGCVDISEEEWDQIVGKEDQKEITEFKGRIASRGKIRAHVKIIMTSKDFPKMADGDIIVASMTRPEFAPILGKCSAIITDEGGVTCHAAIISRELNKPCIIGTKIATKVLKDGDMVEVDADKGVVTILNK